MRLAALSITGAFLFLGLGCITGDPQPPAAVALNHYVKGQILADQGDLDAALVELAEAVKRDPSLSVAYAAAGDIHRRLGSYDMARVSYENACESNPYEFRPHYNLGITYQLLAEAAQTAEKVQDYLRKATSVYQRAVTLKPEDYDANLNLSACYFQEGKYELAEKYCREAIRIKPDSAAAHCNLGIIYDSQNRLWEAIKAYKDSLELDVHQPKTLLNLGSTYMRQNRMKEALHAFELAGEEAPKDAATWEQIGACHYQMKNMPKALEAYQKAATMNPSSSVAFRGMGVVMMTQFLSQQENADLRDKALASWNRSLELQPDQQDLVSLVQKYTPKPAGPQL